MISVIVPTIAGREDHYARCVAAYQRTVGDDLDLITVRDAPACGAAWNEGAAQAKGEYLHFSADDLEPHDGWLTRALEVVDRGWLPAPRIVDPSGVSDGHNEQDWAPVDVSVIPFMSRAQWERIGPSLECHYFTDNYLSWRGARAGYQTVVRRGYAFTHHWAQVGRGAGMTQDQRMTVDRAAFEYAKTT